VTINNLLREIKRSGGLLTVDGDAIEYKLPAHSTHLIESVRRYKADLIPFLRAHGGCLGRFPHCPSCASYRLILDSADSFTCSGCGKTSIDFEQALRVN